MIKGHYFECHINLKYILIPNKRNKENMMQDYKKSRIRETLNLSTDADSSTDTIIFFSVFKLFLNLR